MDTQDEPTGQETQSTGKPRETAKSKRLSPIRILLFLLLAIMIGALAVDQRARHASKAAFDVLDKAIGDEKKSSLPSVKRDEVHRLVGRDPDDDGNPDDVSEEYSWQGVPFKHTVYVMYWPGKEPMLKDVSRSNSLR